MRVAAFDIASITGGCDGLVNDPKPRLFSWHLRDGGESRPARLAYFRRLCDAYFAEFPPDLVCYEKPLAIAVASRIGATEEVILLLRGAIGVLESSAAIAGIKRIESIGVQDARKHFCGRRTFAKGEAKGEVRRVCASLGWGGANDNEWDAACLWSLCCARENPRMAQVAARQLAPIGQGPLFKRRRKTG